MDFTGNLERFSGFAHTYDKYRPHPPAILGSLLTRLARAPFPKLVVDLGSGTGLSTRYWADKAEGVIGVEPGDDMRHQAEASTAASNVSYHKGFSHQTGLPDSCAQIVTCSQSLHWMEPQSTFEEIARILSEGGVFSACDYDWPPTTGNWEADAAYEACMRQIRKCEKECPPPTPVQRWEKEQHLSRMQSSGCFRYTREIVLHHIEPGNAERLVGLLTSFGGTVSMLKNGFSEEQLGISRLREVAEATLGEEPQPWYWCARVRLGVR